jgi:hypothetical protein
MKVKYIRPTEQGKNRAKWFDEHVKTGMSRQEVLEVIDQAVRLFPRSEEERRLKMESLKNVPKFVL